MMQLHKRLSRRRIEPCLLLFVRSVQEREMGWEGELMSMSVAPLFERLRLSLLDIFFFSSFWSFFSPFWFVSFDDSFRGFRKFGFVDKNWYATRRRHSVIRWDGWPCTNNILSCSPTPVGLGQQCLMIIMADCYRKIKGGKTSIGTLDIVDLPRRYMPYLLLQQEGRNKLAEFMGWSGGQVGTLHRLL